ncbi:MAG: Cytochrome c-type biogenesis protein CcmF [Alphaproteobacteria bacterium MarineAlpha5_Bin11]|nr:hypothetical protein [Pelagibacteraceae bacterium]PPR44652.1 MAG: Cytochrome c-type biogenesis protein CcmF [Alphaproteobacteria bacterium MarineAlpha5_Bin11]PPR51202.1 MAG: Cytochrome c-type biogenesis protein CcmF [Alphaproteobacteria bacterium MarineAlpha5_Bin10]|tara:strand:- start:2175 stop:4067 length:1893 start_codon:yes stop_codon:yes gene_type:complete
MISSLGHSFIFLNLLSIILNLFFFRKLFQDNNMINEKRFLLSARLNFLFILFAFLCLMFAYIVSDFSILNVLMNSNSKKPFIYKISGVWGNHEGSILLWILIMTIYTFVFSFNKRISKQTKYATIFYQNLMTLGFVIFMITTSNPFKAAPGKTNEGFGLNPILQDPALAIHPPLLYIGYVGFSLVLSIAISGLTTSNTNEEWVKVLKNYSIFCWSILTAGILTGSFWAYYELGWGGWWFWDPVENASLMPWLAGLALIHSLQIIKQNSQIKKWVIFLSILCFSLSLLGTFLVRSGILMSVHAFATDSSRGLFILMLFFIITGFSLLIFMIKYPENDKGASLIHFNKYTSIIINNIIMVIVCLSVLLGTIYPIIIESIFNERISVGAPYFNSTVLPIMLPGLLIMAIAPALSLKKNNLNKKLSYLVVFLAIIFFALLIYILSTINPWAIIGIGLAVWIIISTAIEFYNRFLKFKNNTLKKIIFSNTALISHFGVGILIIGITASSIWKKEFEDVLNVGDTLNIHNYSLTFNNLEEKNVDNYQAIIGEFLIKKGDKTFGKVKPEKRYYFSSKIVTTEAGIHHQLLQDIYIVIGNNNPAGWSIKVYHNPLVSLIWIGIIFIIAGGLMSIKRYD